MICKVTIDENYRLIILLPEKGHRMIQPKDIIPTLQTEKFFYEIRHSGSGIWKLAAFTGTTYQGSMYLYNGHYYDL